MKSIVGLRPTGRLHIGHYFSVIEPALEEDAEDKIKSALTTADGIKNLAEIASRFDLDWDKEDNFGSKMELTRALKDVCRYK